MPKYYVYIIIAISISLAAALVYYYAQTISSRAEGEELLVYAAIVTKPVLEEAKSIFESKYNVKVIINYGSSGALLSAIETYKKGDVFIVASPDFLLRAAIRGVVDLNKTRPVTLAYLVPAIIVQKGNPKNISKLEDLAKPGIRIVIGDPQTVPAGLYAVELLVANGLWENVSKNIIAYAANVEQAVQWVSAGVADATIAWHTSYYSNPSKYDIVWIEPSKIPKISYIPGIVTKYAKNPVLAQEFLEFLATDGEVKEIWRKYGFFATLEEAKKYAPYAVVEEVS